MIFFSFLGMPDSSMDDFVAPLIEPLFSFVAEQTFSDCDIEKWLGENAVIVDMRGTCPLIQCEVHLGRRWAAWGTENYHKKVFFREEKDMILWKMIQ